MASNREKFGNTFLYTLYNSSKTIILKVMEFGATITQLQVMDKNCVLRDVVLGFDCFEDYFRKDNPYFGATVGRYANRIGKSYFELNGCRYELSRNEKNANTLHGGFEGFSKQNWTQTSFDTNSLELQLVSKNGDEGFPGTITVTVKFTIQANDVIIEYKASLTNFDEEKLHTFINLTNHSYFNLNGCCDANSDTVLNHEIEFTATHFLETDEYQIPTGKVLSVKNYPFMDFTNECELKRKIDERGEGFDDCFVIESNEKEYNIRGHELKRVAIVKSPITGIKLEYLTTEPGFQFYTANSMPANITTKRTQCSAGRILDKYSGLCLESQRFPDASNKSNWKAQCLLKDNETYMQKTVLRFSCSNLY